MEHWRLEDPSRRLQDLDRPNAPAGRAYGDVAAVLGSRGARAVGTVMARYGSEIAWWWVVRAEGLAPRGLEASARSHYVSEKTPFRGTNALYRIVVGTARHRF